MAKDKGNIAKLKNLLTINFQCFYLERKKDEVNIFFKILNLLFKITKVILVLLIILLLLPKILLNYIFILYTVITSPPNYEQKTSKADAAYEALEMSISWIKELYEKCMNKKIINNDIKKSKVGKILIWGIAYAIGLILVVGPILNMCISGYYILNRESILQKNIQLGQEIDKIKEDFRAYGKVYNSNNIAINNYERKVDKIEDFIFEYQIESRKVGELSIEIMEKDNFKFVNEFNRNKTKVLLFKKNEYISEIHFSEDKEVEVTLRRYNSFRDSKWYDILSPIILITSPLNPLRRLEVFNFSW